MAQAHVLKKYLLKIFVWCVISRIEFVPTSDGYVCFFRDNLSDNFFFFKFYSTKRRTKRLKLCKKKKDRSPCSSFRSKQFLIHLANVSSKETFLVRTVRALVRALMTQEIMRKT